ncbi:MAG: Lrp/AsnC family transcriptional regulator [Clostridia bacterium]
MDNTDKRILDILKQDARFDTKTVATMLGLDSKDVANRVVAMQNEGIIVKYTTVVNNEKLESDCVVALIEVRVTPQTNHGFDFIAHEIMNYKEVSSVYLMSGAYDLVVIVEGKNLKEVSSFVSEKLSIMQNVISTSTHFILKKYKSEGVVLDNSNDKQREVMA